jgi:hypothetical protein
LIDVIACACVSVTTTVAAAAAAAAAVTIAVTTVCLSSPLLLLKGECVSGLDGSKEKKKST